MHMFVLTDNLSGDAVVFSLIGSRGGSGRDYEKIGEDFINLGFLPTGTDIHTGRAFDSICMPSQCDSTA